MGENLEHTETGLTFAIDGSVEADRAILGGKGAGLVEIPPVEYRDPTSVVMADPQVAEARRRCARCDNPVGRSRDGRADAEHNAAHPCS